MRNHCLLLLTLMATIACADTPPVAEFSFDEGQGRIAADSSPFAHQGRVRNALWADGKAGKALTFTDSASGVRVGRRPQLNLGTQIAIEAWIYPTVADETSRIIVAKNDEYLLRIDKQPEGGHISFFVHVGSPAVTWEPRASSKEPPSLNQWHHVVAMWDGAMIRLYLDGELQSEQPRTGLPNPNPYPVMIGNFEYPSCHGANFGGIIDEVRIYDQALTAAQVLDRYRLNP